MSLPILAEPSRSESCQRGKCRSPGRQAPASSVPARQPLCEACPEAVLSEGSGCHERMFLLEDGSMQWCRTGSIWAVQRPSAGLTAVVLQLWRRAGCHVQSAGERSEVERENMLH